jgi:conjugal transfer/entry exclusion protein
MLALIISAASGNVSAGGGMTGGATEVTQIANNAELLMQTAEQARQTATQMAQLYAILQDIKSLDDLDLVENYLALPSGTLRNSIETRDNIKHLQFTINGIRLDSENLHDRMKLAYTLYEAAMRTYEETGRTPSELITASGEEDRERAAFFRQQAEYAAEQIDLGLQDMERINSSARSIPEITGSVQGLQFVAGQNVIANQNLKEISINLHKMLQTEQIAKAEEAEAKAQDEQKKILREQAERNYADRIMSFGNSAWNRMAGKESDADAPNPAQE